MVHSHIKAQALHRSKIIKGQFDGLIKAIEREEYNQSLIRQFFLMQRSLKSLDQLLMEHHLKEHVIHQLQEKGCQEEAMKELVRLFTHSIKHTF